MTAQEFPSFSDFFEATHEGKAPLPWQARLAETVVAQGWPGEIGVPTGLGKTACLDVAVWALAREIADRGRDRRLPTRVWYVVNRRLLVDAAYDHGLLMERLLADPEAVRGEWEAASAKHVDALRAVAESLRQVRGVAGEADPPLLTTRLRGGADLGCRPAHPAYPALIFATVPMFASAWLFRGYASSRTMRSVDAAHAGIDALVLLDEAHLSRPLRNLVEPVGQCDVGDPARVLLSSRARPVLVSLTATGDATDPFVLDDDDLAHPVVQQRLGAAKPVQPCGVTGKRADIAGRLVATARELLADRDPCATVVFANTARAARAAFDDLTAAAAKKGTALSGAEVILLTGRMRRFEADAVRGRVLDPAHGAPAGRKERARERHLVIVATQTLEVGADLDFDVLVTESCGARALVQRLGRLNRLGERPEPVGVVVHPEGEKEARCPVYGDEPAEVWTRLLQAAGSTGVVDLSPATVGQVVGPPQDAPARVAELLPSHLWEWAKTSFPPPGEAPIELFYEGFGDTLATISVCWRATPWSDGDRLVPSVHADETVDVPIGEARDVLGALGDDVPVLRLTRDRVALEAVKVSQIRPGDVLVLRSDVGLYDQHGWAPNARATVADVSLGRWPGLPLEERSLRHWFDDDEAREELIRIAKEVREGDDDLDVDDLAQRARATVNQLVLTADAALLLGDTWGEMRASLQARFDLGGVVPMLAARRRHGGRAVQQLAADAFDDLSAGFGDVGSAGQSWMELPTHLRQVGETARVIAEAVGLPEDLVRAVEAAGRVHDLGKADRRFQRWLDPSGEASGLLAKSSTPRWAWRRYRDQSGWPAGGRHEALSGRLLERWLDGRDEVPWDPDLVMHLVVAHHGYGRPLVPPASDGLATLCSYRGDPLTGEDDLVLEVPGDLSETDWDQPARFRRCCERYGYWGLALLEAILRQADHQVSMHVEVA